MFDFMKRHLLFIMYACDNCNNGIVYEDDGLDDGPGYPTDCVVCGGTTEEEDEEAEEADDEE